MKRSATGPTDGVAAKRFFGNSILSAFYGDQEPSIVASAPDGIHSAEELHPASSFLRASAAVPSTEFDAKDVYPDNQEEVVSLLNKMSLKEREDIYDGIHGVAALPEETEDFLRAKLDEMQDAIDVFQKKDAYKQAHFLDPTSVKDRDLRLLMLRTDQYDPKRAALRLINFLEMKLSIFGPDLLVRRVRFDDLTADMVEDLRHCVTRISKHKDRSGRTIVYSGVHCDPIDWKSHFGALYYLFMDTLLRDPEAQKKGFVVVVWNGGSRPPSRKFIGVATKTSRFVSSMPFQFKSYHYCCRSALRASLGLGFVSNFISKEARLRVRSYSGSFMECVYQLLTFGIRMEMMPPDVNFNGDLDWNLWVDHLTRMRDVDRVEHSMVLQRGRIVPNMRDSLLGRGHPYQRHPGNVYLATLIEHNRGAHEGLNRKRKTAMSAAVMDYFRTVVGGRFLRRKGDEWEMVSEADARGKVCHGFRVPERKDLLRPGEAKLLPYEGGQIVVVPFKG